MGSIVTRDQLKTKAKIESTDSSRDAELDQAIAQAEAEFQSEIGQELLTKSYTERRKGTGRTYLTLRYYPVSAVTSVVIEDESAVAVTDSAIIRYSTATSDLCVLNFVNGRVFSRPRFPMVPNVTITYTAGYSNQAAVEDCLADVWSGVLEKSFLNFIGNETRRDRKAGESYMGQSITYFPAIDPRAEIEWKALISRHKRFRVSQVVGGRG